MNLVKIFFWSIRVFIVLAHSSTKYWLRWSNDKINFWENCFWDYSCKSVFEKDVRRSLLSMKKHFLSSENSSKPSLEGNHDRVEKKEVSWHRSPRPKKFEIKMLWWCSIMKTFFPPSSIPISIFYAKVLNLKHRTGGDNNEFFINVFIHFTVVIWKQWKLNGIEKEFNVQLISLLSLSNLANNFLLGKEVSFHDSTHWL